MSPIQPAGHDRSAARQVRAVGLFEYGGPDVLRIVDLPEPHADAGQVRVRVRAAAVNPADVMLRDGRLREWYQDSEPPFIPGMDIAGTIDEIGNAVDAEFGLTIGNDVVGIVDNHGQHGGYSEYIVTDARSVTSKPAGRTSLSRPRS